MYNREIKVN
jgi:tetratricopeptide (TPR) repeat protein